jgi:hypothetical protein
MNALEGAAWEAHEFFTGLGIPYAIIGGLAVQYWGEPRFTQDIDLTVSAPLDELNEFVQRILDRFVPRIPDALDFALRNRIVLVQTSDGYPLDIALGLPGYEDQVMQRAVQYELSPGRTVRLCSAEDLIIHKAVAGRAQDIRDIEGIVYRQGDALDVDYIRLWLAEFADVTANPGLHEPFETAWNKLKAED